MEKLTQTDQATYCPPVRQDEEFVKTREAAIILKVSESKLEKDRVSGKGPKFYRLPNSRTILYRKSELLAFVVAGARQSTSERAS